MAVDRAAHAWAYAVDVARDPVRRWRALALVSVVLVFASAVWGAFGPYFADTSLHGFHDWDAQSSYHYITTLSLLRYHELPWWHPYLCGGFPGWAYPEGAPNLVSPYLPVYLLFPIQVAERLEVVGQTCLALAFAYLLAGRVTKSAALRALVAVAYAINGRWVLQIAEGHMWHLQYAWTPLALYLFDVSLEPGKQRHALYVGMVLALLVYAGGIYPLPHTGLALGIYAVLLAASQRTVRPLLSLAIAGATAFGFAAPKLLPMMDFLGRFPRKLASPEQMSLGQLLASFIDDTGTITHNPYADLPWAWPWHEEGIYVGGWVTFALVLAVVGRSDAGRPTALRAIGLVFLLLGCGAFHTFAPWTLLHRLPGFSSQHVPSRFLIVAVLLLALAFAAMAARYVDREVEKRGWIDLVLLLPVAVVAANIADVGSKSSSQVWIERAPTVAEAPEFHHVASLPLKWTPEYFNSQDLLAMYANTGLLGCYGKPSVEFVPSAIAVGAPGYRGEAYVASGGTAQVTGWTPNSATVRYAGAWPDSTLVYNMNYDPSWEANGVPTFEYEGLVATRVSDAAGTVTFRYFPRRLGLGLFVAALTAFVAFGGPRRVRRWRAGRAPA
jgi:hypothetical protein